MKKIDFILIGVIFLLTISFWLTTINTPYWWDSAGFVINAAKYYLDTNFSFFILPDTAPNGVLLSAMAHPTLFHFLLGLTWKIFGESLFVSHTFYLSFIVLTVVFTYLLGKELVREETAGILIGFSSAIILLFTPLFFAQMGIIYTEIPAAAFSLMAVYFYVKRKVIWYLFSASALLLMKEVALIIPFAILIAIIFDFLLKHFRKQEKNLKETVKDLILYSLPILPLVGFFVWHRLVTGWWFIIPNYQQTFAQEAFSISFSKIFYVFKFFFWEQKRFVLSVATLIFLYFFLKKKGVEKLLLKKEVILLALISVLVPLLFGKLEFLNRYVIFGLPFFYILFFYLLVLFLCLLNKTITDSIKIFGAVLLIIVVMFFSSWNEHRKINNWHFPPMEENLEYLDIIKLCKEVGSFIGERFPDSRVFTGIPTSMALQESYYHYVSKPLRVYDCGQYQGGEQSDLVVFHLFSPGEISCFRLIQEKQMKLLITFEENGKWMEIYKNSE